MNASFGNASSELQRAAAQWFVRARAADAQSKEFAEWLAWMEASPEHRHAFSQIQETWDLVCALDSPHAQDAVESTTPVNKQPQRARWFAIAASLFVVVLSAGVVLSTRFDRAVIEDRYTTSRGEHRATALPDGSQIELGGLTSVAINFTRDQRLVIADDGEAFYKVKRDPERPFVVKSGNVLVKAIGTAFSVRREASIVSIVVEEGVVEVDTQGVAGNSTPMRVQAGERIRIDSAGPKLMLQLAELKSTPRWAPGKLRFEAEPLSVVVGSLNRYSQREILLGDPGLADLQFSGTIFQDRIPQWLQGVQHLFPIKVRETDSGQVVLERRTHDESSNTPAA